MKTLKNTWLILLLIPLFMACNNDDDYSLDNYRVDIATVINPNNSDAFFFQLDNNNLMWTSATNLANYRPKDGQRIIANYTLLSDRVPTGMYNYNVKLNDVYEVLTKGIFAITPSKQDSIGKDSIEITDMWIGSSYLNVEFVYPGYDKVHYINLVSDASKVYSDGKTHLEFRHNSNKDQAVYLRKGLVSFSLKSLIPPSNPLANSVIEPIKLVIHVNVPNQAAEKLYELTFTPGSTNQAKVVKSDFLKLQAQ